MTDVDLTSALLAPYITGAKELPADVAAAILVLADRIEMYGCRSDLIPEMLAPYISGPKELPASLASAILVLADRLELQGHRTAHCDRPVWPMTTMMHQWDRCIDEPDDMIARRFPAGTLVTILSELDRRWSRFLGGEVVRTLPCRCPDIIAAIGTGEPRECNCPTVEVRLVGGFDHGELRRYAPHQLARQPTTQGFRPARGPEQPGGGA